MTSWCLKQEHLRIPDTSEDTVARSIYSDKLRNRTARLKLPVRKKPYKVLVAPGIFLCYRRNAGPGTWSVEAGWLKRFALADDFETANGGSVLTYFQAQAHALKLVRGSEGDSDKPVTVDAAIAAYSIDLELRGANKHNALSVRNHLPPAMLSKTVTLLTEVELRHWRNGLVAKGLKLSSANRVGKSFAAALALAASRDKRIGNAGAWKAGLKPAKAKGHNAPPRDHFYLPDGTILAIVRECYAEDAELGALIEVLAGTGVRESQVLKLRPLDLRDEDAAMPRLMMWCSAKGRDRDPEQRVLPISPKLARMLRTRAIARGPDRPLFDRIWNLSLRFRVVLERLGLDLTLTPYVMRHSSVVRQIRANTALRIIAYNLDTSVVEIERTYGRYLDGASDDARGGLLDDAAAPAVDNVIPLAR
jgi:integrase